MVDKPSKNTPTSNPEVSLIVALMEQIEGMRSDLRTQTDAINRKLDVQAGESKEIVNKIDANATEARKEFSELRTELSEVKIRLAEGSERMKNMRRDIDANAAKCVSHASTTALQRKPNPMDDETASMGKKRMPWWLPLIAGGALAFVGEKLARFVINGLADAPPAASAVVPAPAQPAAPANANNITIDLGQKKQ